MMASKKLSAGIAVGGGAPPVVTPDVENPMPVDLSDFPQGMRQCLKRLKELEAATTGPISPLFRAHLGDSARQLHLEMKTFNDDVTFKDSCADSRWKDATKTLSAILALPALAPRP